MGSSKQYCSHAQVGLGDILNIYLNYISSDFAGVIKLNNIMIRII